jgi:hypothetical protein
MITRRLVLFFPLFLVSSLGCSDFKTWFAKEFRQGDVASGIARLSAQHLSIITKELGNQFNDENTAFELTKDPKEIGKGTIIKTIRNHDIKYPKETVVHKDCLGTEATLLGTIHVIKATQTMYGRLTNNPKNPVIPDPLGIKMTIHVKPDHARIRFSSKDAFMELESGDVKFMAYPRMAQTQTGPLKGLRLIPTANTRFENVILKNVKGMLHTKDITLPFDINNSNYFMQIGAGENGEENKIEGEITAFGQKRKIPIDGNKLDVLYQSQDFTPTYSCNEGLSGIVEYNNVLLEQKLASGTAGLTTLVMGKVAARLADDHVCGLSSSHFLSTTVLTGEPGKPGEAYAELSKPCRIHFDNFQTEPDCFGISHVINGDVVVKSASKLIKGVLVYKESDFKNLVQIYEGGLKDNIEEGLKAKPEPIIPNLRQPVVLQILADLHNVTITDVCVNRGTTSHGGHCQNNVQFEPTTFGIEEGEVHAILKPLMGKGTDPNDDRYKICSVKNVPIVDAAVTLNQVYASIKKSHNELKLVAEGAYRAVNGFIDQRENELSGELSIGNMLIPFRSPSQPFIPLKPDYDRKWFEDSFQSCMQGKFLVPESDNDCSIDDLF